MKIDQQVCLYGVTQEESHPRQPYTAHYSSSNCLHNWLQNIPFLGNLELNFDQIVTSSKYLGSSSRPPPSDNLTTNTWLAFNHCIFFSNQPQDDDAQDDDAGEKILTTFVLCVHN